MAHIGFDRIADFEFVRLLGSGTFAHTYEAERGGESFAVKVFHDLPVAADAQERLRREVRSLKIPHPNLAEYVESGVDQCAGRTAAYIAMRYLPGSSLRDRLLGSGGKLPWRDALRVAQGIASGLTCLHSHGVVHRDLKPANVYLTLAGGIVILDFGLARMQDLSTITARGDFVGTRVYAAPEQIRGESDIHSDLYALGAILFEMLTGEPPFLATNDLELIQRITQEDPEPPAALEGSIPSWLDRLVLQLLAKEPLQRPRDAQVVLDALRDPARHARDAVRDPYDRNGTPVFIARATTGSAARCVLNLVLERGIGPDAAIASVTQPGYLDELHRARVTADMLLAVDTRVSDTATAGYRSIAALRGRSFLPPGSEPHTAVSLRAPEETNRVARNDVREQLKEGATLLRASAFAFDAQTDGWLRRNPRLLEASLAARDALAASLPLYACVPCSIDVVTRRNDRLSVVNRFARGNPDGYWVGIADLETAGADQLAGAVDFMLMLQQLGAPCVGTIPGTLAEFAWSLGIAGVEVPLGRAGGFRRPGIAPRIRRVDHAPRFEFRSIMTSLNADLAMRLLQSDALPESSCSCPSCRQASSVAERLAHADEHNLWTWLQLRDAVGELDADQRVERLRSRLKESAAHLTAARKSISELRSLRHIALLGQALSVVDDEGIRETPNRLRRAS